MPSLPCAGFQRYARQQYYPNLQYLLLQSLLLRNGRWAEAAAITLRGGWLRSHLGAGSSKASEGQDTFRALRTMHAAHHLLAVHLQLLGRDSLHVHQCLVWSRRQTVTSLTPEQL